MFPTFLKKPLVVAAAFAALWWGVRYVLPVVLPFLLGAGLALAAEPLVKRVAVRFPRGAAAGVGVTAALVGILALAMFLGAMVFKELGNLAAAVPDVGATARQGMVLVRDWAAGVTQQAPEEIRPVLERTTSSFFDDGTMLLEQVVQRIPGAVGSALCWVGDGALGIGIGILSAYLISARLPRIRGWIAGRLPSSWHKTYLPALRRVWVALGGWIKAQLKLSAVTWGIVTVGFLVLGIPYAPAWAGLVAVVDAVPILGTGTVLVPWALVTLLQGDNLRAVGLLCIYGATFMTRTVLEPRLVGRQLGLDPLVTLMALYLGLRFWGIPGMLLTPILASAAKSLVTADS